MPTRRHLPVVLIGLLFSVNVLFAEERFHIYAPSRGTGYLTVIEAAPEGDGLKLHRKQHYDLGFLGSSIVAHPEKPVLYVAAVRGKDGKRPEGGGVPAALVHLEPEDEYVVKHDEFKLKHASSYLSFDKTNRYLLSTDYFAGNIMVYPIGDDGFPGKPTASRNEGHPFAHSILISRDNRSVYVPFVKDHNALYQYRFDAKSGSLTPLEPMNAKPPEGTGPRHQAHHPTKPVVYFSNEQHIGVSVYGADKDGKLKLLQVCDAVPDDKPKDGISSSDIVVTPDGRFVFAGIRGHRRDFDRISRYRVREDGTLELLGLTPADKIPWGLALSPAGKYLMVSAHEGGTITAYRIGDDGGLAEAASIECDKKIADLVTR